MNSEAFIQSELVKNELNQLDLQYQAVKEQKYNELLRENKQLKDNWNELKKYAKENLYFYSGYQGEDREEDLSIKYLLEKIQELEGKSE